MIRRVAYLAMHTSPLLQPGRGDAGGMNVYINELACTMAGRGVDVVVFTRKIDPALPDEVEVEPGYRVVRLPAGPEAPVTIADMPAHAAEFGEGVIGWAHSTGSAFDVVHSHYWLSGWCGVLVREALQIPLANSFHTLGRVKDRLRRDDEQRSSTMRLLTEEEVINSSDCVIAATPYEFDDLLEHYGASPERLCVSPPGIDRTMFTPGDRDAARRKLGLGPAPLVLFVGRIQAHKGIDVAIEALARLPETLDGPGGAPRLLVIGEPSGPDGHTEYESLLGLVRDRGVASRVDFAPARPHGDLADYYRAADVLVMPSRSESFGLVAAEAQACGLPVVASRVGGLRYLVSASESGLLVDPDNADAFAAALAAVLGHPGFARRLSEGGVTFAERYSWKGTADRLLELYAGIAAAGVDRA